MCKLRFLSNVLFEKLFYILAIFVFSLNIISCSGSKCLSKDQLNLLLVGTWTVHSESGDLGVVEFTNDAKGISSDNGYFESTINFKEAEKLFNWQIMDNNKIKIEWTHKGATASLVNTVSSSNCKKVVMIDELTQKTINLKRK